MLGTPLGFSPIKPEQCAPIGLKYRKFAILHFSGRLLKTLFNIKLVSDNNNKTSNEQTTEPRRIITKKIGRNEPCPCGSGKKYKQCHGN